ncbi:MAG TPA: hypothetical protein PLM00_08475 [Spirochaetota bacterium]|nr:hypothetical protein [Spirochaetota bacterium]HPN83415.1 hypothetical protein [Spirochaetota bacterium]
MKNLYLISVSVCILIFGPGALSALTNLQAPLAERILSEDGDLARVPIWVWANSLTGDKAAIVLNQTGELDAFKLHRTWRKGQTVGQAMRSAEDYLGRFRVHFERETLTLISLSAEDALKKNGTATGYSGWATDDDENGLSSKIGMMVGVGGEEFGLADPVIGVEFGLPLGKNFDALFRFDYHFDGYETVYDEYANDTIMYSSATHFMAGVRFTIGPQAVVAMFFQAGLLMYSCDGEGATGGAISYEPFSETGAGFHLAGGFRLGSPRGLMLTTEFGFDTAVDGMLYGQFRGGLMFWL